MYDIHHEMKVVSAIVPAVQSATIESDEIDLRGFGAAEIVIHTGAIASSGNFTPTLEHTDEIDSPPDYAAVQAGDLLGTLPTVLEANRVYRVGYVGGKRYLTVTLTKNSGTSIAAGVTVVFGKPAVAPVA